MNSTSVPPTASHRNTSKFWAVLMIVTGLAAIVLPFAAGIGVSVLATAIITIAGVLHVAYALASRLTGEALWHVLIGLVYFDGGVYMMLHPVAALASLTLLLAALLWLEGIVLIVGWARKRSQHGAASLLLDGIATLILSALIAFTWPGIAGWLIGTLIGINLVVSGAVRLMRPAAPATLPLP